MCPRKNHVRFSLNNEDNTSPLKIGLSSHKKRSRSAPKSGYFGKERKTWGVGWVGVGGKGKKKNADTIEKQCLTINMQ